LGEKLLDNKVESSVQVIVKVIELLDSSGMESFLSSSVHPFLEVFVGTYVEAGMEVCQWDSTHAGFHNRMTSFLGGTVESLTDLDNILFPTENLSKSFVSTEDSNHVLVLGRISICWHRAKVKGDRVDLVKLELLHVFGEGEKNLVLGFGSLILDLSNLHGGSFGKGLLVTFCALISKCTTLKTGKLSSVV
jgi:hypothetical protein